MVAATAGIHVRVQQRRRHRHLTALINNASTGNVVVTKGAADSGGTEGFAALVTKNSMSGATTQAPAGGMCSAFRCRSRSYQDASLPMSAKRLLNLYAEGDTLRRPRRRSSWRPRRGSSPLLPSTPTGGQLDLARSPP